MDNGLIAILLGIIMCAILYMAYDLVDTVMTCDGTVVQGVFQMECIEK